MKVKTKIKVKYDRKIKLSKFFKVNYILNASIELNIMLKLVSKHVRTRWIINSVKNQVDNFKSNKNKRSRTIQS